MLARSSFRPTLVSYGVASTVITSFAIWRAKRSLIWAGAICLGFCLGLLAVLWTNQIRFGSLNEFGYSLNLNSSATMRYASRFPSPYAAEPLASAAPELLGLLFRSDGLITSKDGDVSKKAPSWLSPTFRWREIYFRTYDLSYFFILLTAIALLFQTFPAKETRKTQDSFSRKLVPMAGGAFIPIVCLGCFYLRFPFVSSRYLFDFGAAIALITYLTLALIAARASRSNLSKLGEFSMVIIVLAWWIFQVSADAQYSSSNISIDKAGVISSMKGHWQIRPYSIPQAYTNGFDFSSTGIAFNGSGSITNGDTRACVVLFTETNMHCAGCQLIELI